MIDILMGLGSILIGYLIGSVSFSRVVTRLVSPGVDLQETLVPVEGTEHNIHMNAVSATSVRFKLGPKYGLLASFLDMVKIAVPVGVIHYLYPDSPWDYLAAAGGLIGHNWPVYHKFKGGYGQSAIYGALLVLDWTALPVTFFGTALIYLIVKQVHIASFGGVLLLLPYFWYRGYDGYALLYAGICALAYLIQVYPDFRSVKQIERQSMNPADED
jgi:glycerol-3-phosphate acyltransferase PlsY